MSTSIGKLAAPGQCSLHSRCVQPFPWFDLFPTLFHITIQITNCRSDARDQDENAQMMKELFSDAAFMRDHNVCSVL
jgi:hypothetical protein